MKIATAIAICLSMVIIAAIVLRNPEDHAENIASFRRSIMANQLAREDDEDVQGQLVEEAFEDAVAIAQILRRGREIQAAITRGVMREGGLGGRSGREGESAEFNDLGEDADAIEMDDLDAQGHLQSQGDNTHSDGHDGHDAHHGQGEDPDSDDGLIEFTSTSLRFQRHCAQVFTRFLRLQALRLISSTTCINLRPLMTTRVGKSPFVSVRNQATDALLTLVLTRLTG